MVKEYKNHHLELSKTNEERNNYNKQLDSLISYLHVIDRIE